MISLSKKHDILREYIFIGKGKKTLAREHGVSRNTVKRYIQEYEDTKLELMKTHNEVDKDMLIKLISEEPSYDTTNRNNRVATDEILDLIRYYIDQNESYRKLGIRKQCMKATDIYEALIEKNHEISYSSVVKHVRNIQRKIKEAFIKQSYNYGDVCEFDWGDVKLIIADKLITFKMAAFTTAKGNYRYGHLYRKESMQFFLDSHVRFFNKIGGSHKVMVYDNMKVAVAKFVGPYEKEATNDLKSMSLYYGFNYRFCNIASGNEKGHVEKTVEFLRRKAFSKNIKFDSLEEANNHLNSIIDKINNLSNKNEDNMSANDILEIEKPYLNPLMPDYDVSTLKEPRVDKYSTVCFENNRYSVPDTLVGEFVMLKAYTNKIYIYHNKEIVAEHKRLFTLQKWSMNINHYKRTLLRKPGALKGSLAFEQIEPTLRNIYNAFFKDKPKEFIEILDLIQEHGLQKIINSLEKLAKKQIFINIDNIKLVLNSSVNNNYNTFSKISNNQVAIICKENNAKYNSLMEA